MRYLDANIFLRYLTRDDPTKARACYALFQRLKTGEETATTCEAVITEVVYVLSARAHYNLAHDDVRARLAPLLAVRGLKIPHKRVYFRALDLYATYPFLDFEDAVLAAHMDRTKDTELYSYDTDFNQLPAVTRMDP
jgi:predicted nucleic acid-binding protein